jgi:hypothetical protein
MIKHGGVGSTERKETYSFDFTAACITAPASVGGVTTRAPSWVWFRDDGTRLGAAQFEEPGSLGNGMGYWNLVPARQGLRTPF